MINSFDENKLIVKELILKSLDGEKVVKFEKFQQKIRHERNIFTQASYEKNFIDFLLEIVPLNAITMIFTKYGSMTYYVIILIFFFLYENLKISISM